MHTVIDNYRYSIMKLNIMQELYPLGNTGYLQVEQLQFASSFSAVAFVSHLRRSKGADILQVCLTSVTSFKAHN